MASKYLDKSKFVLVMECPTKLYYASNPEYANTKANDDFLQALAEGGFQVAELAKCYYRDQNPVDLKDYDSTAALAKTNELLQQDEVVIFEAAVQYENLFLRADILVKKGNSLRIVEVKSKSIDLTDKYAIVGVKGKIKSDWKKYLYDIAFQKFVLQKAFPDKDIVAYLMLVDKAALCPTDGLHQKFKISRSPNGKVTVTVSDSLTKEELSTKILKEIKQTDDIIREIYNETYDGKTFGEYIRYLSDSLLSDQKIQPKAEGSKCSKCEFRTSRLQENDGLLSGFKECWSDLFKLTNEELSEPTILDVWDFRDKKDKLISMGVIKMKDIDRDIVDPKADEKIGWSRTERQWQQICKVKESDNSEIMLEDELRLEIKSWKYPLHFIDFETIRPTIPFNKGMRPCQGMAFQFSHHTLSEEGIVKHEGEYLNKEIGVNPNLEFIRKLKCQLEADNGTIFMYSPHENSYLNEIYRYIVCINQEISDHKELYEFIKRITVSSKDSLEQWRGERAMVDLWVLGKRYYYDPLTNGSNSIKDVYPAILHRSKFLQDKYSKPIYGSKDGIKSLNFENKKWVEVGENGAIMNPYDLLDPLFKDIEMTDEQIEYLFGGDEINKGGSASIAYSRLQFSEMSSKEREDIVKALLSYCELDTLAMVMIIEAWRDRLKC